MLNEIFIRRSGSVVALPESAEQNAALTLPLVATLDKNLESLGYGLSLDLANNLLRADVSEALRTSIEIIDSVKKSLGAHKKYDPMYPNFPHQVIDASEVELYLNAMMHYTGDLFGVRILPDYEKELRPALNYKPKRTELALGTAEDLAAVMRAVANGKVSMSETDQNDVREVNQAWGGVFLSISPTNKENLAFVAALVLDDYSGLSIPLTQAFKTATDVLRLAVAMSEGDVSLAEKTKFRNFKKSERRVLLSLLEGKDIAEDLNRHKASWLRLGERIHPGDYANKYPGAAQAFKDLRNNKSPQSFASKVEAALQSKNAIQVTGLLSTRPGEFARRLDDLIVRFPNDAGSIISAFNKVSDKVSPSVLVQVAAHFAGRTEDSKYRPVLPKGSVAKIQVLPETRDKVSVPTAAAVITAVEAGLHAQFKDRGDLGKVYVDEELFNYAIPFGMRSGSKALHTVGRGSRADFGDGDILRFFSWWKDGTGQSNYGYYNRTDIDLSAVALGEDFTHKFDLAYYNLRESGATHSGDITSAPEGASEFIDIDIPKLLSKGVRYVAMTVHVYSGQKFDELPECFAGFMMRNDADSGEIYEPKTVQNKFDLTSSSKSGIPLIFDLEERTAIWLDLGFSFHSRLNNAASQRATSLQVLQAMVERNVPTVGALLATHADVRGTLVTDRAEADTVFALDGDVGPYDVEVLLDEYL